MTNKEELFAAEYIKDFNQTQAAIRAGFSPRSARQIGYRLTRKPCIANQIEAHKDALKQKALVNGERVLIELSRVGYSNIRDFVQWDGEGNLTVIPSAQLPRDLCASVQEISRARDGTIRFRLYDKPSALRDLGRHLGLFEAETPAPSALETSILRIADKLLAKVVETTDYSTVTVALPSGEQPQHG